ncbi:hypothetical protein R1sor_018686 [Riccia sorocarpa]|uniref:Uncharacterized protein n=1 Tax=Riccia sorocarpa TaxID=122646 RepID=A0ABD3IDQ4_9MARC
MAVQDVIDSTETLEHSLASLLAAIDKDSEPPDSPSHQGQEQVPERSGAERIPQPPPVEKIKNFVVHHEFRNTIIPKAGDLVYLADRRTRWPKLSSPLKGPFLVLGLDMENPQVVIIENGKGHEELINFEEILRVEKLSNEASLPPEAVEDEHEEDAQSVRPADSPPVLAEDDFPESQFEPEGFFEREELFGAYIVDSGAVNLPNSACPSSVPDSCTSPIFGHTLARPSSISCHVSSSEIPLLVMLPLEPCDLSQVVWHSQSS